MFLGLVFVGLAVVVQILDKLHPAELIQVFHQGVHALIEVDSHFLQNLRVRIFQLVQHLFDLRSVFRHQILPHDCTVSLFGLLVSLDLVKPDLVSDENVAA